MCLFLNRQPQVNVAKFIRNEDVPSLARLRKMTPIDYEIAITFLVKDILNSFAGPHKASDMQVVSISEAVIAKYYYLKLEEVIYIFGKAKSGGFGVVSFSGIDQIQVMRWFELYDVEERLPIARGNTYEIDNFTEKAMKGRASESEIKAFRENNEARYYDVTKEELDVMRLKELYSHVSFERVLACFPTCTKEIYLEQPANLLFEEFEDELLADKAKDCQVCFEEYSLRYPNKTVKTYLKEDNDSLRKRFGKEEAQARSQVVKYLTSFGLLFTISELERLSKELSYLIITDYEKFKQECTRLIRQKLAYQTRYHHQIRRKAYKNGSRQERRNNKYKRTYQYDCDLA